MRIQVCDGGKRSAIIGSLMSGHRDERVEAACLIEPPCTFDDERCSETIIALAVDACHQYESAEALAIY